MKPYNNAAMNMAEIREKLPDATIIEYNNCRDIIMEDKYGRYKTSMYIIRNSMKPLTIKTAIDKNACFAAHSREHHGDKFDYSKVDYKYSRQRVTVICPEHGEFETMASWHMSGKGTGCKQCWNEHRTIMSEKDAKKAILARNPNVIFIEYTTFTKHAIIKLKGEYYRIHPYRLLKQDPTIRSLIKYKTR